MISPLKGFTLLIYIYRFLSEAMPIYVFYALIFADSGGLSTAQISSLFFIWGLVAVISEVPTGVIADKYSRKYSLVLANLLRGIAFIIWMLSPDYAGFAAGFVLWAIGGAFQSGSFEAYLYDHLKSIGKTKQYGNIYSRSEGLTLAGMVFAYLLATLIGQDNTSLLYALSITITFICGILALLLPKERIHSEDEEQLSSGHIRTAIGHVQRSPRLLRFVVTISFFGAAMGAIEEFVPLYYKEIGLSSNTIAIVLTISLAASALLTLLLRRAHEAASTRWVALVGISAVAVIAGSVLPTLYAVITFFVFMRILIAAEIAYSASLQHEVSSNVRATTGSLIGLADEIGGLLLISIYGLASAVGENVFAVQIYMLISFVGSMLLLLLWKKSNLQSQNKIHAA